MNARNCTSTFVAWGKYFLYWNRFGKVTSWLLALRDFNYDVYSTFFAVGPLLPTRCRCRRLLFHLITHMDTYTLGKNSLGKGSTPRSSLYLFNAKHSQEKNILAPAGIQTPIPASERSQAYALNIFTLMFSLVRQRSVFSGFTKLPVKYRNLIPSFLIHFTTISNCFFDDWQVMSWKRLVSGCDLLGTLFRHLPGRSEKKPQNIISAAVWPLGD